MPSRRRVVVCWAVVCLAGTGCRPAIKALTKVKPRPVAKSLAKPLAKLPKKPPVRIAPRAAKPRAFVAATRFTRSVSRAPQIVAASKALGASLQAKSARIPARVFAQLWSQWQRNHAELSSLDRRLAEPGLDPQRRTRLEEQVSTLEQKNAEIERLAAQWG